MGRIKSKRCPWDTRAEADSAGNWTWKVGQRHWCWRGQAGMNTFCREGDSDWVAICYSGTLEHAVCFSWGYQIGEEVSK